MNKPKQVLTATKGASAFFLAFQASLPTFFGYIPTAFAFGFLFQRLELVWYLAPLMSLLAYGASAQFLAISLLSVGASLLEIGVATLVINSRHIFYGLSLFKRYKTNILQKIYMMLCLTDETYSTLTVSTLENEEEDFYYCFYLSMFNHLYWVLGTTLGTLAGNQLSLDLPGLDFTLTALFAVLTIEQAYTVKNLTPFLYALVASLIAIVLFPNQMLFMAIAFVTIFLISSKIMEARAL
jgi:4-azaleucine resistance transporter AzlC